MAKEPESTLTQFDTALSEVQRVDRFLESLKIRGGIPASLVHTHITMMRVACDYLKQNLMKLRAQYDTKRRE